MANSTGPVPHDPGKIALTPSLPGRPVPINAVCPECKTRFRLQDAMAGKLMRCTACQEMFTVWDAGPDGSVAPPEKVPPADTLPRTRVDAPAVVSRSGNVTDFVQVIHDVAPVAPPRPAPPPTAAPSPAPPREKPWAEKGLPAPSDADFPWSEAGRAKSKAAPKEVAWTPDLLPPTAPPPPELGPLTDGDETDDERPSAADPPAAGGLGPVAGRPAAAADDPQGRAVVAGRVHPRGTRDRRVLRLPGHQRIAETAHGGGPRGLPEPRLEQARRKFDQVVEDHPSHPLAPEARFMSQLSQLRQATTNMLSRTEPQAGLTEWTKVMADPTLGEFGAQGRFAVDLWEAGTKLEEDLVAKANEVFTADNPDPAEKWLARAAEVDTAADQFRDPSVPKNDRLPKAIDGATEQDRRRGEDQRQLAELDKVAGEGPDAAERFDNEALLRGLANHPKVKARREERERLIQGKASYTREANPIQPTAVPDDGLTSLLFAPRFDSALPRPLSWTPTVFFCQARGVLYARSTRRAAGSGGPPAPGWTPTSCRSGCRPPTRTRRWSSSRRTPATSSGSPPAGPATAGRSGTSPWPSPARARRPCVGPNAYVGLADETGTVLEIAVGSGEIVGRITLGRPLGPVIAARPGTGLLYVPGDAHAVYVFAVNHFDPAGLRQPPSSWAS